MCVHYLPSAWLSHDRLSTGADEEEDVLGVHRWHEEILRDAGGDYSYLHVSFGPRLTRRTR